MTPGGVATGRAAAGQAGWRMIGIEDAARFECGGLVKIARG